MSTASDLPTLLSELSAQYPLDESDAPAATVTPSTLLHTLCAHHLSTSAVRRQLPQNQLHDIIDALITCMGTHLTHRDIQTQCLSALSNLAQCDSESTRDYLVGRGALTLAAEAMRHHPAAAEVQAGAGALLANCVCAGNAKEIRTRAGQELGMVGLVVRALQDHRGSIAVARYGCAALGGLAVNDHANCATIGEGGGLDAVVDVLGRYGGVGSGHAGAEETTIVDTALTALHNLTMACKPNRDRLARRHGSVATIVTAVRGHEDNDRIAKHGLGVVRQLVEGYATCADGGAGAAVIVRAMERHADREAVQTHGVALFRRLASTDPRQVELGLAGAVERTVQAMVAFGRVREVQFQAAAALHNLSIDSEKNGDRAGAAGGIGALLKAIENFEDDEKLVDVCCRTLHRLSYVGTNKMRIRREDPTNLLFNVSKRYPKSCGRTAKGVLKNV